MSGATMAVVCGDSGFVFGIVGDKAVALNGYSASFRDGSKVRSSAGAMHNIVTADKRDLVAAGVITTAADPLVYNEKATEGLKLGLKACPT